MSMGSMKGHEGEPMAARRVADGLGLAAAPTFVVMALLAGFGGGPAEMLCSAGYGGSPLSGMEPMYWLMSVFHLAPWVRLITRRRDRLITP